MRLIQRPVLSILLLGLTVSYVAAETSPSYYPLAVGNSWRFAVHQSGKKRSYVIWKVTKRDVTKKGVAFQVWPIPMNNDDDAAILISESGTIKESGSGVLLVKDGLHARDQWALNVNSIAVRHLMVLHAGRSCKGVAFLSSDCIVIADTDDRLRLRTVTYYGRGIGPMRVEYYEMLSSTSPKLESTLELVGYHLEK